MTRKNFIPLLGIAFAVAVVSTWIFYGLVKGRFEQAAQATSRTVVVAAKDLEPGATIAAGDVRPLNWTGQDAPADAFAVSAQVVGGHVVTRIAANDPITKAVVETSEGIRAGNMVPLGKRAVPLRASNSEGLMTLLARGSLVDIQAVSQQKDAGVLVKTILERIPIVNIQKPGEEGLGRNEPAIVTVLVDSSEADKLAFADSAGKIRFALRNPADEGLSLPVAVAAKPSGGPASMAGSVGGVTVELSVIETGADASSPSIAVGQAPAGPVAARWTTSASAGSIAWIDRVVAGTHVRLAVKPTRMADGRIEALVEPELSWQGSSTPIEARRLSRNVAWAEGEKLVVTGLSRPGSTGTALVISARRMQER